MARGVPNPERDARVLALHNLGLDQPTIAERLGLTDSGVGSVLKRLGVRSKSGPRRQWSEERFELAKAKWIEGLSASAIARQLGVSKNAVIGQMTRHGVQRPSAVIEANRRKGGPRKLDGTERKAKAPKPEKAHAPRLGKIAALIQPAPFRVSSQGQVYAMPESQKLPRYTGVAPGSNPKPFLSRMSGECTWPVSGEGADTFSCWAPVHPGTSWCEHHNRAGRQNWGGKGYHAKPDQFVADTIRRCA